MVERSTLDVVVDRMTVDDLAAVHEIERESFSTPWPAHAYRQELSRRTSSPTTSWPVSAD